MFQLPVIVHSLHGQRVFSQYNLAPEKILPLILALNSSFLRYLIGAAIMMIFVQKQPFLQRFYFDVRMVVFISSLDIYSKRY